MRKEAARSFKFSRFSYDLIFPVPLAANAEQRGKAREREARAIKMEKRNAKLNVVTLEEK